MSGPTVHQVFFPGNHGNMGWVEDTEGFVHAPFAWMIQQLHSHLQISFDEAKLAAHFPSYRPRTSAPPISPGTPPLSGLGHHWYTRPIPRPRAGVLAAMGRKPRQPGKIASYCEAGLCDNGHDGSGNKEGGGRSSGSRNSVAAASPSHIQVHIGARLRTDIDGANAVPGYALAVPVTGPLYWARWRSQRDHSPRRLEQCRPRRRWGSFRGDPTPQPSAEGAAKGNGSHGHCCGVSAETMSLRPSRTSWSGRGGGYVIAERIEEAAVGALEASLLGLPEEAVADGFCCCGR